MKRVRSALEQDADKVGHHLGATGKAAVIGGVLSWGAVGLGIGEAESLSLGILLVGAAPGAAHHMAEHVVERIKERMARPDYWCLISFADVAYELTNAWNRVGKLWRLPDKQSDEFAKRLDRLRDLQYG